MRKFRLTEKFFESACDSHRNTLVAVIKETVCVNQ